MSEIGTTPLIVVERALEVLQASNLKALTTGDGRGLSTREMAEILDRELGFTDLHNAVKAMCTALDEYDAGHKVPEGW